MAPHQAGDGNDYTSAELVRARRGRLLRAIFETEPQCVKLLGPDGTLRLMNPAGLRMIEAESLDEVRGHSVYPLVVEQHRDAFQALVERVFRGEDATLEFQIVGLKGTPRWLETQAVPLRDESGRVASLLGITRDVTDRVLANAALRESERNFRTIFEQAIDGVFICDDELRFLDVNPAGCQITGYSREQLLTLGVPDLVAPDERPKLAEELSRLAGGAVAASEWHGQRPDGTRYIAETTAKRLSDGRYQAFVRDITDRKQVEAQLLQAQKMENIGRLAGGIAHDFNNLLTVVNGTADLAIAKLQAGDPLRADLEQIRHAGERAAGVTRQLLAMSRQQILQVEVLDLNAVIRDMEGMLELLLTEDVRLELALAEGLGSIRADPSQIEQVILNLAANARDAMPEGGTLTLETRRVAPGLAEHRPLPPGPLVMLAVRDTGTGMDEAARRHVFEPFFTTKDVGRGTGLGLSTVYGIVKQSGGSVWVDSRPGAGTVFTIYFPHVEAAAAPPRPAPAETDARGDETILVVDDEPGVCTLTRRLLESAGYRVITAANAAEALQVLEASIDGIHLMLTDIVMPEMNGSELASRVARLRPGLKVLFTTGYAPDTLLRRGVLDATSRVVAKPFTARELRRQVRETLDE